MQMPVYSVTTQFIHSLETLKAILKKGRAWADGKKVDWTTLMQTRLIPDQLPLGRQIQIASDNAKGCAARLAGVEPPKMEDKETSFEDYMTRIDRTIEFMRTLKPEQCQGWEGRKATFPWNPGMHLEGKDYLPQFALPNFYFHMTTAYSILRASGVDLGKSDYLGTLNWKQG